MVALFDVPEQWTAAGMCFFVGVIIVWDKFNEIVKDTYKYATTKNEKLLGILIGMVAVLIGSVLTMKAGAISLYMVPGFLIGAGFGWGLAAGFNYLKNTL